MGQGVLMSETVVNAAVRSELPLVLAEGSHSIYMQWKSDLVNWTVLTGPESGFALKEQMVVLVSSNNSVPSIDFSGALLDDPELAVAALDKQPVHTPEDVPLDLLGISVADVDSRLYPGMVVDSL